MDVVTGLAIAVVTAVVLITGAVLAGFAVLFRRRGDSAIRSSGDSSIDALSTRAGSLLVRLDDALREADDELGYAIAQFGPEKARQYADALAAARVKVAEAFRLKQALDDATPDSQREQREWTLQIIALTEQAEKALAAQDAEFSGLRRLEVNAAGTLTDVRTRIATTAARVGSARAALDDLAARFAPETFAQVAGNPDAAEALLATASSKADAAAPAISASGVSAVSATLQEAGQAAHRADQLLDAVDRTVRDLAAADAALDDLRSRTRHDLAAAKSERDVAPDADTGEAIIRAIGQVESILSEAHPTPVHPVAELDRLSDAVAELDAALARARNQAQRLEHARAAYAGTLVSAKSQIAEARSYIGSRGGGVSARTRLAEAERQLVLAQAETDPIEALDAVRRAVTHARDADALARFDTLSG
jgi:chromosome segregation ATPase